MKLRDISGIRKKTQLKFLKAKNTFEDYYEIELEIPKNLSWRPGEHGVFTLPNKKVEGKKFRAFSIASRKEEGIMLLGTRTGKNISSFKRELINMEKGDIVTLRGPFGWFVLDNDNSPVVLIALGVGVTPIRALLTELDGKEEEEVEVIYSSNDKYLYKDTISEIIEKNKSFNIKFTDSVDSTNTAIDEAVIRHSNNAKYYISGKVSAIKAIKKALKSKGIKSKNILNDPFFGY